MGNAVLTRAAVCVLACSGACVALGRAPAPARAAEPVAPKLREVRRIWDEAPHNAFTDLTRFRGRWYCVFREGKAHVSPDGALRVLASADGKTWKPTARITSATADLRDAKISETPDGRLMLNGAGALHPPSPTRHQSLAWFSSDGAEWGTGIPIGDPDMWLWRVTWQKGVAYCLGYNTNPDRPKRFNRLYSSRDGANFATLADRITPLESPGEHALVFLPDDTCLCLLRRDAGTFAAQLGRARPPYREWTWRDLGVRIGGPEMLRLPDGRLVAGVRLMDGRTRTALCWVDPEAGTLREFLTLPSGGDTSYCGFVWHEGDLWVSYYSSHEGKAAIYLARVAIPLS